MTIEQWILLVIAPAAIAIWGLIKVIGPKFADWSIRRREATTEQMAKLIEQSLAQNSLMISFITEGISADNERTADKMDRQNQRLIAIETLTRLMVFFVAQLSDNKEAADRILREMTVKNGLNPNDTAEESH